MFGKVEFQKNLRIKSENFLNNPHELNKAQEELNIHVGKEMHVSQSTIFNLDHLQAIIKKNYAIIFCWTFNKV